MIERLRKLEKLVRYLLTLQGEAGIGEAPKDGNFYARRDGAWVNITNRLVAE